MLDTNPRDTLKILLGSPWALDADRPAVVDAFPHIGSATSGGDRVTANGFEMTGYVVRGWYGHVVATDGL